MQGDQHPGFGLILRSATEFEAFMSWLRAEFSFLNLRVEPNIWQVAQAYHVSLSEDALAAYLPGFDSLGLRARLLGAGHLGAGLSRPFVDLSHVDLSFMSENSLLEVEILVGLSACPYVLTFPSFAELQSSLRVRRLIAQAASKTALSFDTQAAERPEEYWIYDEDRGFTIKPGVSLIEALIKATQPAQSGRLFSFSCYRASEYVMTLGIAQELFSAHPQLYAQLERRCEKKLIRSGQFHDVFLVEYGANDAGVPANYYVPGDRVWFRNPDERSSDIAGYEGSWVIYLGGGYFSNFWKLNQPYSLEEKCLEVFHWRDAVQINPKGEAWINEETVETLVASSSQDIVKRKEILAKMMLPRAPRGVYNSGGCIDTTRESPRWLCPQTCELVIPEI
jgi:Protein-glutamine gamma-glutamyltransferase